MFVRNLLQRKLNQAKCQCWGESVAEDYVRNKGLSQRKELLALQKDLSVALKEEHN